MTHEHPITLPPEVLQQLRSKAPAEGWFRDAWIAEQAAKWGADQELEACCEWIADWYGHGCNEVIGNLRTSRRPKPPSLKEQALIHFDSYAASFETSGGDSDLIRRALEQLPDHE